MIPLIYYFIALIGAVVLLIDVMCCSKVASWADKDMGIVPPNTKPPRVPRP